MNFVFIMYVVLALVAVTSELRKLHGVSKLLTKVAGMPIEPPMGEYVRVLIGGVFWPLTALWHQLSSNATYAATLSVAMQQDITDITELNPEALMKALIEQDAKEKEEE